MSDSESVADREALVEANPMVDRDQLDEAHDIVERLREAGLTPPPSYRIDSPYERGQVAQSDLLEMAVMFLGFFLAVVIAAGLRFVGAV